MAKKIVWNRVGWGFLAFLFIMTGVVFSVIVVWQSTHQSSNQNPNQLKGTKLTGFTPTAKIDKLKIADTKKGNGKEAKAGSNVTIQYVGALAATGVIFDDSYDTGQAAALSLKPTAVIPGFYLGVQGMKVGGERQIYIPSAAGYGKAGSPPDIPPNADLVFDVVLVSVQ